MLKHFDESIPEILVLPVGCYFLGKEAVLKGNIHLHFSQMKEDQNATLYDQSELYISVFFISVKSIVKNHDWRYLISNPH